MNTIVPLISSGVAGPLGVLHLPRLWLKVSLEQRGKLAAGYPGIGKGYDQMVLDGIGLAYVLEDTARPYLEDGRLVAVLEDWSEPFAGFALYYPKQRQMPGALRAFVDMLRE